MEFSRFETWDLVSILAAMELAVGGSPFEEDQKRPKEIGYDLIRTSKGMRFLELDKRWTAEI